MFDPDNAIKADIVAAKDGIKKIHDSITNELKTNTAFVKVLNTHLGEVAVSVVEKCMAELVAGTAYYDALLQTSVSAGAKIG